MEILLSFVLPIVITVLLFVGVLFAPFDRKRGGSHRTEAAAHEEIALRESGHVAYEDGLYDLRQLREDLRATRRG